MPERLLDGKRITDCFSPHFFTTSFWYMWCTTFAFNPWHSASEFRRYLNRFIHLFPTFDTMSGIYRTRYNQYDSIVRPLLAWLNERRVNFQTNTTVTDLTFAEGPGITVTKLHQTRDGCSEEIALGRDDLVFVTNGSMTANSSLGLDRRSTGDGHVALGRAHAPVGDPRARASGVWTPRRRSPTSSRTPSGSLFTVTTKNPSFFELMEKFQR
jgi:oleate hydratase